MNAENGNKDLELVLQGVNIFGKSSVGVNLFLWTMIDQECFPRTGVFGDLNRICF
jgi:hypothetical protein